MKVIPLGVVCGLVLLVPAASPVLGDVMSYAGILADPDSVFLQPIDVSGPSILVVQTWSYGGGLNSSGVLVSPGGFDPVVSLFGPTGEFIDENDDGPCPPANFDGGFCADSRLVLSLATPGTYVLALTAFDNVPAGINLSDGFTGGGDFGGRTANYAVDVSLTPEDSLPEPNSATTLVLGILLCAARRMTRR